MFNTTNMRNHLRRHHPSVKMTESKVDISATTPPTAQTTVNAVFQRSTTWDLNDPKAMKQHRCLAEMIALDNQPFSIVENEGFVQYSKGAEPRYQLPSEKYMRETAGPEPELYKSVRDQVEKELKEVQWISLTTDTWTRSMCSESLMSLTGHWILSDWTWQLAVLQTSHLLGSHTAAHIKDTMRGMLDNWSLASKVHAVLCDNGKNVTKAMDDVQIELLGCMVHTVQLAVKEARSEVWKVQSVLGPKRPGSEVSVPIISPFNLLYFRAGSFRH